MTEIPAAMTSAAARVLAHVRSEIRELVRHPLPNGDGEKVLRLAGDGELSIHHVHDAAETPVYTTATPDDAEAVFTAYDGRRDWHHAYLPRGQNPDIGKPEKVVAVYAAGADPVACLHGFLDGLGLSLDEASLEAMEGDGATYQWGYRFASTTGTAFKACGRLVPGGAIMTWWM